MRRRLPQSGRCRLHYCLGVAYRLFSGLLRFKDRLHRSAQHQPFRRHRSRNRLDDPRITLGPIIAVAGAGPIAVALQSQLIAVVLDLVELVASRRVRSGHGHNQFQKLRRGCGAGLAQNSTKRSYSSITSLGEICPLCIWASSKRSLLTGPRRPAVRKRLSKTSLVGALIKPSVFKLANPAFICRQTPAARARGRWPYPVRHIL